MILGYIEDGPNLVALAMNGWAGGEPVWWLNLQAHPAARIDLAGRPCTVTARAAEGQEPVTLAGQVAASRTSAPSRAPAAPTPLMPKMLQATSTRSLLTGHYF